MYETRKADSWRNQLHKVLEPETCPASELLKSIQLQYFLEAGLSFTNNDRRKPVHARPRLGLGGLTARQRHPSRSLRPALGRGRLQVWHLVRSETSRAFRGSTDGTNCSSRQDPAPSNPALAQRPQPISGWADWAAAGGFHAQGPARRVAHRVMAARSRCHGHGVPGSARPGV